MQPSPRHPVHWFLVALAPVCVLGLLVLGTLVTPAPEGHGTHTQLGLPPCLPMARFGVPCPGCGVTTSVALAARGQLLDSLLTQPLGALVALGLACYPFWVLYQLARRRDLAERAQRLTGRASAVGLAVAVLVAWLYKLGRELT